MVEWHNIQAYFSHFLKKLEVIKLKKIKNTQLYWQLLNKTLIITAQILGKILSKNPEQGNKEINCIARVFSKYLRSYLLFTLIVKKIRLTWKKFKILEKLEEFVP